MILCPSLNSNRSAEMTELMNALIAGMLVAEWEGVDFMGNLEEHKTRLQGDEEPFWMNFVFIA